jgi:ankyrin repeat protein
VTKLLDAGVKIESKNDEGYTPLIKAAVSNKPAFVELLLKVSE